jgi:aspartate/methionine/tyrosine aminotransferase
MEEAMQRFELEDFFDEHEHVSGPINLASSDALPWRAASFKKRALAKIAAGTLAYPDVKGLLLPGLKRFCKPPRGIEVLPTSGAAEAIALVMHELHSSRAARDHGFIAIPSPGYGAFAGLASLLGLPVKSYDYGPDRGWAPDLDELLNLSKQCAALIVNNPHNPSGHVIPDDFLKTIAGDLASRGAVLIVDEVFRTPGETKPAIRLGDHVVTIGSLSKIYGLPGLRIGWVTANKERLSRLRTLQQYFTLTLNTFSVALGSAVLQDPERFSRAELIRKNRILLMDWAEASKATLSISPPLGGTTVCLTVNSKIPAGKLFKRFKKAGVLLAPGERCFEFGHGVNWFRLCYGTETKDLKCGLARVNDVVGR